MIWLFQKDFETTLYNKFNEDQKASLAHFAKLKSLTIGEYLYDHYCYTPNVKRLQKSSLKKATFKDDKDYYENGDCYTEVISRKIGKAYFKFSANKNGGHGQDVRQTLVQAYK